MLMLPPFVAKIYNRIDNTDAIRNAGIFTGKMRG
jgi:hypothetical protein